MRAKQYLNQIRTLDARIRGLQHHCDELRANITASGSAEGERVKSSREQDPVAARIIRCVDLEFKIDHEIDRLIEMKDTIIHQINGLDNGTYIELLSLRYVFLKKWEEIADEMGYVERQIYRIHGEALLAFERIMPDDIKCQ